MKRNPIDMLQHMANNYADDFERRSALVRGIEALRKQEPVAPVGEMFMIKCRKCGSMLVPALQFPNEVLKMNYCTNCGQKILWKGICKNDEDKEI